MSQNSLQAQNKIVDFVDVKSKLMHRFLYHCDSSAMQILLNLYDLEEKIHNIFPSYVSMKNLKRDILYFLKRKDNRSLFAGSLTDAIYDDVNRFELAMYLAGYRQGLNEVAKANELEVLALEEFDIGSMFERRILYQYDIRCDAVEAFYKRCIASHVHGYGEDLVREQAARFSRHILKRKVYTLNHYVDRQLQVNFQSPKNPYRESDYTLSQQELAGLNRKLKKFIYRDGLRIYCSAYWCGINDLVLRRYHP